MRTISFNTTLYNVICIQNRIIIYKIIIFRIIIGTPLLKNVSMSSYRVIKTLQIRVTVPLVVLDMFEGCIYYTENGRLSQSFTSDAASHILHSINTYSGQEEFI